MTLYVFEQGAQGEPESVCYEDCADAWPPLTVDRDPQTGDSVEAELETFERESGEMHGERLAAVLLRTGPRAGRRRKAGRQRRLVGTRTGR